MSLTDQLRAAVSAPATSADFDVNQHLEDLLNTIGVSTGDSGGKVTFCGADPILPSTLRLAAATGIGLAAKAVMMAKLWQFRDGPGQDISLDLRVAGHRLCPFYDKRWELLNGYPIPALGVASDAFAMHRFYRTADDRWVMPLNPYPKIGLRTQMLLDAPGDPISVAKAIATWNGTDLEQAGEDAGVVMPMVRSTEEFLKTAQYQSVLSSLPVIEIEKIGDSDPIPFSADPSAPLSGVRALGRAHIIAGAGQGRAMALHGADVLNVWQPGEYEVETMYCTSNVGVRSTWLDIRSSDGRKIFDNLLASADVFYANRRPGYLESVGLDPHQMAETRPGIIHSSVTLNGHHGPWAKRVGFDQTAGCLTGVMQLEGDAEKPGLPPVPVVNDYIMAWLATAGIVEALIRRATEGGSYRVGVSLSRTALWILSLGIFDKDYARATSGSSEEHEFRDPEYFVGDTPLGEYTGITEQIHMSETPGRYPHILVPRGSSPPKWLER
ncbi:CoA transferase [Mycolicibacterium sp. BiH015]|uniref:CoA transferase n=1 Tax=Mycolicibacterium sp. BiH015 TaxID=3018808 RepID=UPI0022E125D0|nr:CoA transferase [Mycolicibacterium sp. BiH015]MDA2893308.1 CoA transferase [Mycolicibacterium sp. BiH015]